MRASMSTACSVPGEAAYIVAGMQTPPGLSVPSQDACVCGGGSVRQ